jgi:hypothetical protein
MVPSKNDVFVQKAIEKHGDTYDYSNVEYNGCDTKVTIRCKKHGDFGQAPRSHLLGSGCPACSYEMRANARKMTTNEFVQKAIKKHGTLYDYSKVECDGSRIKVTIRCKVHGDFEQVPSDHLSGNGCAKCGGTSPITTREFIRRAIEKHGDTYDYSRVDVKKGKEKVIIRCNTHGDFEQIPTSHLLGYGCVKCGIQRVSFSKNPRLSADSGAIWRTIPEYPKYEVSSNGEIRNTRSKNVLSLHRDTNGYLRTDLTSVYLKVYIREANPDHVKVEFREQPKTNGVMVHRAVASAFLENPRNLPTVNHKNHDKENNRIDNLEWASYKQQNAHKRKFKTNSCARGVHRKDTNTGAVLQEYRSITDAVKWVNDNLSKKYPNGSNIVRVCKGRSKTFYGFAWSYADTELVENEEWKPIGNEYADYFISNQGRIKYPNGRISEGSLGGGYRNASIKSKLHRIHRLVASTFIPNPKNYQIVNHKDGNKTHNAVHNLEWCSYIENNQHAHDTGLQKNTRRIRLVEHGLEFSSCAKASVWIRESTKFEKARGGNLSARLKKHNTAYGFTWEYV